MAKDNFDNLRLENQELKARLEAGPHPKPAPAKPQLRTRTEVRIEVESGWGDEEHVCVELLAEGTPLEVDHADVSTPGEGAR